MSNKQEQTDNITPAMRQYLQIKERYPDSILFFRMGDFYEMFFEDALTAAPILEIALTTRNKNKEDAVPLCGFPYHAVESYIAKLVEKGFKVALCDQIEDPKQAKGIVKREVVRVITPGLATDSLTAGDNNFLLALSSVSHSLGYALIDVSTGEAFVGAAPDIPALKEDIGDFNWQETVIAAEYANLYDKEFPCLCINHYPQSAITKEDIAAIRQAFPQAFGEERIEENKEGLMALLLGLFYILKTQKGHVPHISRAHWRETKSFLIIDDTAKTNLEIFISSAGNKQGSLLSIIDRTITPMGARKLKWWLASPLKNILSIAARHDAVGEIKNAHQTRVQLRNALKGIGDIERLTGRITMAIANARDILALKNSLTALPTLKKLLMIFSQSSLSQIQERLETFEDVVALVERAITDSPPLTIREGGIIKRGYDTQLDEMFDIAHDGKKWIAALEEKERRRTGIPSLKVGFNNVFGYYIEITKAHSAQAPSEYIRKQTLVNAERYINEELKGYEETVLGAEEKIREREYQLFCAIRSEISAQAGRLRASAAVIAEMDCLASLAEVAERNSYTRPRIDDEGIIEIKDGRHPVVERMHLNEAFVPNDTFLDWEDNRLLIITGPNMAGKSTYIRQVALLVIMAQMGSFLPASSARIGIVDRVFTRIGAADNLARGQSTFMVEMVEVANILHNATPKSLIVLDEVGRGTSTFDGMSIAWAVAEYLLDKIGARALFATHYHQLTELALVHHKGVKNYNIAVKEYGERIIFLRKILEGGASRSYGIQVARLAGIPNTVIGRAKELLLNLEENEINILDETCRSSSPKGEIQMGLFEREDRQIMEEIKNLDPETMTPIDALNTIHRWHALLLEKTRTH